ncbi:MAG: DDE-type integrase/transposase/recombinase, partial [Candidatus Micrarchaeota archaeon]
MDRKQKMEVATFRFSVIADFVCGRSLDRGEKERLLNEKKNFKWLIPYSRRTHVSRQTILAWIRAYKNGGRQLEALMPKTRKDKGKFRKLSSHIRLRVKELKQEKPKLTMPAIINELHYRKLLEPTEKVNVASLYRYLKHEKLHKINKEAVDRRRFEAGYPNELWQSDIMHGPYVKIGSKKRKTYLIAILDDYSRLLINGEFYLNENISNLTICLKEAFLKRGLCQTLYIDNGACYRASHLEQIAASLGVAIK